jgi:hypothetical protein
MHVPTAAEGGHLEVLRWAREHDCPWDVATCAAAAEKGHLEVLRWAREHDCPWDSGTRAAAAAGGRTSAGDTISNFVYFHRDCTRSSSNPSRTMKR